MRVDIGAWASVKLGGRLDQEAAIRAAKARIAINALVRKPPVAVTVPIPIDPPIASMGGRVTGTFGHLHFPVPRTPPKLGDISKAGRDYFRDILSVSAAALMSHRRQKGLVRARHVIFYLAKELTDRSLPEIGYYVGEGRDHTTILHAIRGVRHRINVTRDQDTIDYAMGILKLLTDRGFLVETPPDLETAFHARPGHNSDQGTANDLA